MTNINQFTALQEDDEMDNSLMSEADLLGVPNTFDPKSFTLANYLTMLKNGYVASDNQLDAAHADKRNNFYEQYEQGLVKDSVQGFYGVDDAVWENWLKSARRVYKTWRDDLSPEVQETLNGKLPTYHPDAKRKPQLEVTLGDIEDVAW